MVDTVLIDLSPLSTPTRTQGIGRYLRDLAIGLSRLAPAERRGLDFVGLTELGWTGGFRLTEDLEGFARRPWAGTLTKRDHYRWAYRRRVALWRALRRIDPALVHLGDPGATPLGMRLAPCPRLVTCHDVIPLLFPDRYLGLVDGFGTLGTRILRRRYRSADHLVAVSEATRQDLVRVVGIDPDRISQVYNAVALERWTDAAQPDDERRAAAHGLADKAFVLYVGALDWRKNVDGMLAGLERARAAGADVHLALVGRDRRRAEVREQARRAGLAAEVHLLGYVSDQDLGALYRRAKAHLFVSRSEGFGFTVVEAMASGCPVITTRCGSLGEVAGQAALQVDPEDHDQIARAIVAAVRDEELRRELVRRGLDRAPRFGLAAQARAMVAVYRRAIDAGRS